MPGNKSTREAKKVEIQKLATIYESFSGGVEVDRAEPETAAGALDVPAPAEAPDAAGRTAFSISGVATGTGGGLTPSTT